MSGQDRSAAHTKGCGIRPGGYGPEEDVNKRVARKVRRQMEQRPSSTAASLRWHYEDGTWWAESPEFLEWSGGASSLDEARLLAHEGLRFCAENDALTIIDPFGELPASVTR